MPKNADGPLGEDYAARLIARKGYTVLERNYRTRRGEIDIIARKRGILAFIEVKTRRQEDWAGPAAAVTRQKQRRLILAACQYLQSHPGDLQPRFDVIALTTAGEGAFRVVSAEHLEGAFDMSAADGFF